MCTKLQNLNTYVFCSDLVMLLPSGVEFQRLRKFSYCRNELLEQFAVCTLFTTFSYWFHVLQTTAKQRFQWDTLNYDIFTSQYI